jgi:hypothetical protein
VSASAATTYPHPVDATREVLTVDPVSIPEEVPRRRVLGKGLDQLARRPDGRGMIGDVEVEEFAAIVAENDEDEEEAEGEGGDNEEVDGDELSACAVRKAHHVGDGRGDVRCMYLATVSSATA